MKKLFFAVALTLTTTLTAIAAPPTTFTEAKIIAKQKIYFDQANSSVGDLYCGCKWTWVGKTGGRIDAQSCGYETRKQQNRAERTEWEHIVPAWTFGHQRQCWQTGGRENCVDSDPTFRAMEADLFNLYPAIGEVNGDRSNFNYGMAPGVARQYGQCTTKIDFQQKAAEPRDQVKGLVARTTFYMFDRYKLSMSRQQQQVLMAWDRQHPVTAWEIERNQRISRIMGHSNPFVTGERTWTLGYKPTGSPSALSDIAIQSNADTAKPTLEKKATNVSILGNRNSHVYHLASKCPGYHQVAEKNQVLFSSEADAQAAGYRRASNCK
ncbi:endonuclease [Pseudomonas monteilii]|uniref:endonuclease n=1 Tax=Pseudomonas monteilii TaxID=76759 RepID=UPI003D966ECC